MWRRQFIGGLIFTLMKANGFEKTGDKRRSGYKGFTMGEVYGCTQTLLTYRRWANSAPSYSLDK